MRKALARRVSPCARCSYAPSSRPRTSLRNTGPTRPLSIPFTRSMDARTGSLPWDIRHDTETRVALPLRLRHRLDFLLSVAHAVGEMYVGQHETIEHALIEAFEVPKRAHNVSVSLDRVSVPIEEPRPRPAGRPTKKAAKRPITRAFR